VIVATRDPRVAARCSRTIEIGMTHAFEDSRHA
jgi:predicted ABC-type transport system involved in lysophospholipase L1 biosynthesis ATPase subunit